MSSGEVIGVLGGGQLGRMLALAGIPLGLRFRFLEPDPRCPAADVGEVVGGAYDDPKALARFADGLAVATYEFENVPAATARWLTEHVPVYPPEGVLGTAQDRLLEKRLFRSLGIGTPEFETVDRAMELAPAVARIGLPCVLKSRRLGYDGRGQRVLKTEADVREAAAAIPGESAGLILESFVRFARELSIIAARSRSGEEFCFPATQNVHEGGILRESIAPAPRMNTELQGRAERAIKAVMDSTGYVGVLVVELFELPDGTILANEMAPRVHNSGHWTQNGCAVSQFEMHLRAIMGWPLDPGGRLHDAAGRGGCSAMLNILQRIPAQAQVLRIPGAHLHLYGKAARPPQLRKVGHINITAPDEATLQQRIAAAKASLADCL